MHYTIYIAMKFRNTEALSQLLVMPPTSVGHYEMMGGVCPSVCRVPRPNSRTERPRKPKIGRMEAHHTGNP